MKGVSARDICLRFSRQGKTKGRCNMRADSSCEGPVGPNAVRSLSTTFALFVVLLSAVLRVKSLSTLRCTPLSRLSDDGTGVSWKVTMEAILRTLALGVMLSLPACVGHKWMEASVTHDSASTGNKTIVQGDLPVDVSYTNGSTGNLTIIADDPLAVFDRVQSGESPVGRPTNATHRASIATMKGTQAPGTTHVLVIGINQYRDPAIPGLRYARADARAVYRFFRSSPLSPARPSNVHYVGVQPNDDGLAATERGIKKAITRYLINKAVHKDDMALLYFAGHGDTGKHPTKGTEYYLIPADAERADLFNTAIELSAFKRLWSAIRAETKVLIADACNSGGFSGVRGVGGATGLEAVGRGKIVLSASKADQKSLEVPELGHGLFTSVLLDGLKGKADQVCGDNDGRVTAGELKRYLDEQVPAQARRYNGNQTPVTQMLDAWGKVYLTR